MRTAFSILALGLVLSSTAANAKTTTIGLETVEGSRSVQATMDDCFDIDAYELLTLFITKKCRVFTGPMCTGRTTVLEPGEHSVGEPVPIGSVLCEESDVLKMEL
ncbi:uncharacterized protein BDV17DRAFT_288749 [Aspergillus undulatus]|uniref:uncharacterized protein n=1 Tax=Aspergillus undulatus TaxID=1810928 RepID=UPI003CCE4FFB